MSSSSDGKVSCEHCHRAYAWQEKYAGKKVRCKCGQALRFPATDPADQGMELELNLDSGIDLNMGASKPSTGSHGGDALATPDGQLNVPPPANLGGPTCPSCKTSVRPGAVICVSCGFNLKEGSKLNTSVGVQMSGGGQVYDDYADGIFGRFKRSWTFAKISYGMIWDFKQLLIFPVCSGIAALIVLLSFALPVGGLVLAQANSEMNRAQQRQAQMQPADTEAVDTTTDATDPNVVAAAGDATQTAGTAATEAPATAKGPRELTEEEKADFAQMRQELIAEGKSEAEADKIVAEAQKFMFALEDAFGAAAENGGAFESRPAEAIDYVWLAMWGLIGFAFYFCNYFVIAFFNTGLIACAMKIMRGEVPTVGYGMKIAMQRLPQILAWALVSAVVGMILKIIEGLNDKVGRLIAWILGAGWTILTFFVVPVITVEGVGPFKAIKSSVKTMKEAWGDSLRGNFSLALMTFIVTLPIYVVMGFMLWASAVVLQSPVMTLCVLAGCAIVIALISVATSAADTVFKAILYSFASGNTLPAGFDTDAVASAFARPRKRGLMRLFSRD